ncbi:hypothetical protein D9M70_607330 [compost metagenome]
MRWAKDLATSGLMPTRISRPSMLTVAPAWASARVMRVSMKPKATALTLTLKRPHSRLSARVMPITPALAEE